MKMLSVKANIEPSVPCFEANSKAIKSKQLRDATEPPALTQKIKTNITGKPNQTTSAL